MKLETALLGRTLRIRNYADSDLEFLTNMWFDKENGKYLSDPTAQYVDEAFQKALSTLSESRFGYYLVAELADTGEPVGSCSIFPDEDQKICDIGYCIHKAHWRKGWGSEVIGLLLDWCTMQKVKKVTAEVAVDNLASNALLRKFGFQIEKKSAFQKYNMDISFDSYIFEKVLETQETGG